MAPVYSQIRQASTVLSRKRWSSFGCEVHTGFRLIERHCSRRWFTPFNAPEHEPPRLLSQGTFDLLEYDRVSGIFYIPNPASTRPRSVIAQLPRLPTKRTKLLNTAIFFVTPGLGNWVAIHHRFLGPAINQLYAANLSEDFSVTSIVAIVDALPGPNLTGAKGNTVPKTAESAEGIAMCFLPQESIQTSENSTNSELSLIHFQACADERETHLEYTTCVSLQVANTLFVNNNKSTLFSQEWKSQKVEGQPNWAPSTAIKPLTSVTIPVDRTPKAYPRLSHSLEPMSKPRKVVSSMGNVIRELEGDDGLPLKASAELEEKIPEFLKTEEARNGRGSVQVYASVYPPEAISEAEEEKDREEDAEITAEAETEAEVGDDTLQDQNEQSVEAVPQTQSGLGDSENIRHHLHHALWKGGRLHKVTGGGGGWGKKAGLLSLDTRTDFGLDSKFNISMFPSFATDDDGNEVIDAVEEAVPPGSTIQFFATFIGPSQDEFGSTQDAYRNYVSPLDNPDRFTNAKGKDQGDHDKFTNKEWANQRFQCLTLGTTPLEHDATRPSSGNDNAVSARKVLPVIGSFGMLSQNGLCLSLQIRRNGKESDAESQDQMVLANQFRVDAPHVICRSFLKNHHCEEGEVLDFGRVNRPKKIYDYPKGFARPKLITSPNLVETTDDLPPPTLRKHATSRYTPIEDRPDGREVENK